MGTSTKTKHIDHPKPDLSFGRPLPTVFFEGVQKNSLQKKTQQQQPSSPVGFSSSFLVSSLRRCQAFARGISEETSVSMRLREALGTLEAQRIVKGEVRLSFSGWVVCWVIYLNGPGKRKMT